MNESLLDLEIHETEPHAFSAQMEAAGCYLEIDGKILLLQYSPPKAQMGRWDVPGGKLEAKESPEEGALRELFEETGIALDASCIERILTLYIRKPGSGIDYVYYLFKVSLKQIPDVILSSEHQNYTWAETKDIEDLPLVERAGEVLELYYAALRKNRKNASVNAYLILRQKDRILFYLRKNTGYCDGMWGLVAGHVEDGEPASAAIIREAREEIGLELELAQLQVVHVMHRKSDRLNVDIFFDCPQWDGVVSNREPDKCDRLEFFSLDALPSPLIDCISRVLKCISQGQTYSEYGWMSNYFK